MHNNTGHLTNRPPCNITFREKDLTTPCSLPEDHCESLWRTVGRSHGVRREVEEDGDTAMCCMCHKGHRMCTAVSDA